MKKLIIWDFDGVIADTEHIATDKYVEFAEEYGISSATIRNELKLLEDYGLLEQPHVSAGRVPSTEGYRYYVDNLMKNDTLAMVDIDYINNNIVSYGSVEKTLEHAAEVVAKVLNLPTVLNVKSSDVVEQVKILKISDRKSVV